MADPQTPTEAERLEARNREWWRLWTVEGRSQYWIAERYGVTQGAVSRALAHVRSALPEVDREAEIRQSLELLQELRMGALEVYRMRAAPAVVGKDGDPLYDPETQELVRDHTGRLRALETAIKVDQRISQLLGLDAAAKMDLSVATGEARAAEKLAADAAARLSGEGGTEED